MSAAPIPTPTPAAEPTRPLLPETIEATGLSAEFVVDLLLKTLYVQGARAQYAVRVLGATGRTRVLKYEPGSRSWVSP